MAASPQKFDFTHITGVGKIADETHNVVPVALNTSRTVHSATPSPATCVARLLARMEGPAADVVCSTICGVV